MIGTASIRRRAQLASLRPDLKFVLLRGNVGTRLDKLARGDFDATLLACAGLKRLGQDEVITEIIEPEIMLPAPAQGAIGLEVSRDNPAAIDMAASLNHRSTALCILAERAFLKALDGSCRTPVAALCQDINGKLIFRGELIAEDGSARFVRGGQIDKPTDNYIRDTVYDLGFSLGQDIRVQNINNAASNNVAGSVDLGAVIRK